MITDEKKENWGENNKNVNEIMIIFKKYKHNRKTFSQYHQETRKRSQTNKNKKWKRNSNQYDRNRRKLWEYYNGYMLTSWTS